MYGDTITITHNAVARILVKINQDNYSSEYLLRNATDEFLLKFKHSIESAKSGVVPFERHLVEYAHTTFATATELEKKEISSILVRCRRGGDPALALQTAKALVAFGTDPNLTKLIAWES